MQRIGLALSGGGFRATLFHLGMVRFLRDAKILPTVTHITSVSGGSILAAHLVLNWHRYTGSPEQFDAAAAELIRFVQLDIRNRVVRRFPLAMPLRLLRRLALRRPHRQLTRTGLLEYHYQSQLYGDTCLFQLPERPRLFILATNLSEGCLCAFTRDGLLMQRRLPGQRFRFDRIHAGLATVPMAVTASSAFPGFFPPLELQGPDVGADPGQFGRLAFTDGGIYDNLGVRMFRCLEQSWMAREIQLEEDDLTDAAAANQALHAAEQGTEDTALRRLAQMVNLPNQGKSGAKETEGVKGLLAGLEEVMKHENLAREPIFAGLSPPDPDALALLNAAHNPTTEIDAGEQLWLNRLLVEAAFRQATGKPCFRSLNACFDGVLVSDAGKQFKISANTRAGGLISTAMRSTDIVMDRVWQLETDTFSGTPGFVFAPIGKVVEPSEDPTALHPEVQRQATNIRTDLDRFSPLEISSLIRHGYCVGRSICRTRSELFGTAIPTGEPWDPLVKETAAARPQPSSAPRSTALATKESRQLQASAGRRLWSTLLDYRDWASYLYVPLLVPILILLPYFAMKWYRQAHVAQSLVESMVQNNQDYAVMKNLMLDGPISPFKGLVPQEAAAATPPDSTGIEIIADMRVLDLRPWKEVSGRTAEEKSWVYSFRRVRLHKTTATANRFITYMRTPVPRLEVRARNQRSPATLRQVRGTNGAGAAGMYLYELEFDLSRVQEKEVIELFWEAQIHEPRPEDVQSTALYVDMETGLLTYWLLMPEDRAINRFNLVRYPLDHPTARESVVPARRIDVEQGKIIAFSLLSVKPGFVYECLWTYPE